MGSGTGRFTPLLADAYGGIAVGLEPSPGMRTVATRDPRHPRVRYLAGRAEEIPLRDASCDVALLYFVLHHLENRVTGVAELRRVLRPGGRLLVRSNFADRMPDVAWYRYFPSARRVDAELYPTLDEALDAFRSGGFAVDVLETLEVEVATNRREMFERLRLRAISTFEFLGADEIESGLAAMDQDTALHEDTAPVVGRGDLLVLSP